MGEILVKEHRLLRSSSGEPMNSTLTPANSLDGTPESGCETTSLIFSPCYPNWEFREVKDVNQLHCGRHVTTYTRIASSQRAS